MNRSSAVLMHITSVPGPFGIGTMGEEAKQFAERIADCGFCYWQILPLLEPSIDSPYQSLSAFAGYTALIDPREMVKRGLLYEDELEAFYYRGEGFSVDYQFARENSQSFLKRAYSRLTPQLKAEVEEFAQNQDWLMDYALFLCIREDNDNLIWNEWPNLKLRAHDYDSLSAYREAERERIDFVLFSQWLFWEQWHELKSHINSLGLDVFGDIAYYVATDSAEVWAHAELFLLDEDFGPSVVAGVPPDYFSESGQRWGNAIYDWQVMEKTGYRWWITRIAASLDLYDLLRIDHFRGFSAYWAIPADSDTAINGRWEPGPGMKFFHRIRETLGAVNIVAEDLGDIDEDVQELLEESGFPGMMVLQFAFQSEADGSTLPHHYRKNSCVYTGTHDNDTLLGWLWNIDPPERERALDYINFPSGQDWSLGGAYSASCRAFIKYLWSTVSDLACAPIQDFLGFGADTRMNTPGVEQGQWSFRLTTEALETLDTQWVRHLNLLYERFNSIVKIREEIPAETA